MKNLAVIISSMVLITFITIDALGKEPAKSPKANDSIHVWYSPDLGEIATAWVLAYKKANPDANLDLISGSSEMLELSLQTPGNIAIVSKAYFPDLNSKSNWNMIVGRDVLVPVMNPENPFLNQILKQGISPEAFARVFTNSENQQWGTLLNNQELKPVDCFMLNGTSTKLFMSDFFKTDIQNLKVTEVQDANDFINIIKDNKYAIGFCSLSVLIDSGDKELINGISLIPIDINGNLKLDYFENIYNTSADFNRGLWIGKYPQELYSRIYAVTAIVPVKQQEVAFFDWILFQGQQFLPENGFNKITSVEQQRRVQSLYAFQSIEMETKPNATASSFFLIIIIIGISVFLLVFLFTGYRSYRRQNNEPFYNNVSTAFGEQNVETLAGLFFDKTHTWAFMEKNGGIRIGIDDFLQHVTGPISKIKMKNPGEYIKKGEPFLTLIQKGKQLEINAPASGIIKENNGALLTQASLINASPYGQGWVYLIESDNWLREIKSFLLGDSYKIWIKEEFARLKTFFLIAVNNKHLPQTHLVMQDGGELNDHILENFGPEIWEEFQIKFINHL
jgi:glycine cleavage system H lipoate-binding protein/ABC-type phosphate transport system substrate-binding protein